jgi:hypothetical protein
MGLVESYNFMVVFSFVAAGATAHLLAFRVSRSYAGSLAAGFAFTFGAYHFAHAAGHMQLVSLEWIPLFLLAWLAFIDRPSVARGAGAAGALFLVGLCDYYYLFYCVAAGAIAAIRKAFRARDVHYYWRRGRAAGTATFIILSMATSGALASALLLANARDPFLGAHPSREFSTDLLAPIVHGGHWRFSHLTRFYWSALPGNINESSVHLGWAVLGLLTYIWIRRRRLAVESPGLWFGLAAVFFALSLGPTLRVWGRDTGLPMPYALLEIALPPLRLSGMPVRMMVMTSLAASIVAAVGIGDLRSRGRRGRTAAAALMAAIAIESWPQPMPTTELQAPEYVHFLRDRPERGPTLDLSANPFWNLYFQTVHRQPLANGYLARYPASAFERVEAIRAAVVRGDYGGLRDRFGVRYVVVRPDSEHRPPEGALVFEDGFGRVFDLHRL